MNYSKARRNLVFFIGLLALSELVGLAQRDQVTAVLPFRLARPEYIPHVLAVVVFFSLYNLVICYVLQEDSDRKATWRLVDFALVVLLSVIALAASAPHLLTTLSPEYYAAATSFFTSSLLPLVVGLALSIVTSALWVVLVRRLRSQRQRERIFEELVAVPWMLVFNPQLKNGRKVIQFLRDGQIGEGRNENESRWSVDGTHLAIWRANGDLQNRFFFDSKAGTFVSTNEPEADAMKRGIRDQAILRMK